MFGAIDPSSGTAVMKEISRVIGQLVKTSELYKVFQNYISLSVCLSGNSFQKRVSTIPFKMLFYINMCKVFSDIANHIIPMQKDNKQNWFQKSYTILETENRQGIANWYTL